MHLTDRSFGLSTLSRQPLRRNQTVTTAEVRRIGASLRRDLCRFVSFGLPDTLGNPKCNSHDTQRATRIERSCVSLAGVAWLSEAPTVKP